MTDNTSKNKTIAKNTIYLYLRMIVSMAISLYTSRAVLDALGVEDYGIYNIVGGFVALLNVITTSLVMGAQRFITFELGRGDENKLHRTFATFSTLFLIMSVVIFAIAAVFGKPLVEHFLVLPEGRVGAALFVFYCSLASFAINLIAVPYNACVIAHEKMDFFAIVSIGESFSKLLIVYLLYTTPFDRLQTYAVLLVAVGVIVRLTYGIYCSKHFKETKSSFLIDKDILKEVFSFSLWMFLGGLVMIAKEQGVNVVINLFCGVTINAARGISMQVSGILSQFANSIASAINPQITKSYAEGNLSRSINLTFLLTKAQGLLLLLIAIPLYFEMDFVLGLWLKEVPYYADVFAKWVLIITLLTTIRNTYSSFYLASGDVKTLQWTTSLIYIMILPLSYLALKMGFEPVITMQITAVIEVLTFIASYVYLKYKFQFPLGRYLRQAILPLCIVCFASSGSLYALQKCFVINPIAEFFIIGTLSVLLTGGISYLILLSNNERTMVKDFINKKLHRS